MDGQPDERRWKVGELAVAAGLTVRTLHHFDEIGLVRPAERSAGGHRLYTGAQVRRLYQVLALRDLGMSLSEIAAALDTPEGDLGRAVRRQLDQLDRRLAAQHRLRGRLAAVLQALEQAGRPTVDQLVQAMEAMMEATYFTPEQLARLKERHRETGGGGFGEWLRRGSELDAEIRGHLERDTDPADPAVQALAHRWTRLMTDMVGDDRHVLASMYRKIEERGAEEATRGVLSSPSWDYLKRAFAVGYGSLP